MATFSSLGKKGKVTLLHAFAQKKKTNPKTQNKAKIQKNTKQGFKMFSFADIRPAVKAEPQPASKAPIPQSLPCHPVQMG